MNKDTSTCIPNLFVAGVPKAGSTSLYRWLSDHPAIGTSSERELRYLMDTDDPLARRGGFHQNGAAGYSRFYRDRIGEKGIRYLIDVSPQYYYQETARNFIPALPDRKVLMILRKPSRRLYSLYKYALNNIGALPAEMGFPAFVEHLHQGRRSGILGGKRMLEDALNHSNYMPYMREWAEAIGKDDFKIVLFENLVSSPHAVTVEIAQFLGINPEFYAGYSFQPENASIIVRSRSFHRLSRKYKGLVPAIMRRVLKPVYLAVNSRSKIPLTDADRRALETLDQHFRDSEKALADWLQRDTPFWGLDKMDTAGNPLRNP